MKPFSNDLRRRVVEAVQANEEPQEEIAACFHVSASFVWHRFLFTGSYEPLPHRVGRRRLLADAEAAIRRLVADEPDLTLFELAERVARETNTPAVSEAVKCVELQRLRLPLKKSRFTPPGAIPSVSSKSGRSMTN